MAAQRTKGVCTEFCRKVLTNYNRYQTYSKKRIDELPKYEEHLKQLHAQWREDELSIQLIKSMDEREIKNAISQAAVNNHLLEYQLRLLPSRKANIKSQVAKYEFIVRFIEPSEFKTIVADANTWDQFINEVARPTQNVCFIDT